MNIQEIADKLKASPKDVERALVRLKIEVGSVNDSMLKSVAAEISNAPKALAGKQVSGLNEAKIFDGRKAAATAHIRQIWAAADTAAMIEMEAEIAMEFSPESVAAFLEGL